MYERVTFVYPFVWVFVYPIGDYVGAKNGPIYGSTMLYGESWG